MPDGIHPCYRDGVLPGPQDSGRVERAANRAHERSRGAERLLEPRPPHAADPVVMGDRRTFLEADGHCRLPDPVVELEHAPIVRCVEKDDGVEGGARGIGVRAVHVERRAERADLALDAFGQPG